MNIDEIIKRIKISCGYASEAALARALKMSPQNFNSQKKTGKIKDSLQAMLGHAQVATTEWYTHVVTDDIRAATADMFKRMRKRQATAQKKHLTRRQ